MSASKYNLARTANKIILVQLPKNASPQLQVLVKTSIMKFINKQLTILLIVTIVLSLLFSLMNLFRPLSGDELVYHELAENLLTRGQYYLDNQPSTFSPIVPFLIAICYIKSFPALGFALAKLLNWIFVLGGLYFASEVLKRASISNHIRYGILMLSISSTHTILTSTNLYPEALLIGLVWLFLFLVLRALEHPRSVNYFYLTLVFAFLVICKYIYAVFGVFLIWVVWTDMRTNSSLFWERRELIKHLAMGILGLIPLLVWGKYITSIEVEFALSDSYFSRFRTYSLWERIEMGLGFNILENPGRNGIPALISLFIPKEDFRDWFSSIFLLILIYGGLFSMPGTKGNNLLCFALLLLMLGLMYAATGFSRYWLPMLPVFWLGIYFSYDKLKWDDRYFIYFSLAMSTVYLLNACRLNIQFYLPLLT